MKSPASRPPGSTSKLRMPPEPDSGERISRKQRELLRHRAELLEATERLLSDTLLHDLTIQDIAAESEFSVGYIYKLFDSKADLIAALITEKLKSLRAVIEGSESPGDSWEERVTNLLVALTEWLRGTPIYGSRVTPHLKDFAHNHPSVAAEFAAFLEFYGNFIDRLFSDAVDAGFLREEEPGEAARSFRALVAGFCEEGPLSQTYDPGTLAAAIPLIIRMIKRTFAPLGGDL